MVQIFSLINPSHPLVSAHTDKILLLKRAITGLKQQLQDEEAFIDFNNLVWTEEEIIAFEKEKKISLPDEYKIYLMEIGEVNQDFYRHSLTLSLKNRKVKEYNQMKKMAVPSNKMHNIGSLNGKGWINESVYNILKDQDKFKLYRKVPLFATDSNYAELFGLPTYNAYLHGMLSIGDEIYLVVNGEYKGEVWKYGSEPEGIYAASKYMYCLTQSSIAHTSLLDFILARVKPLLGANFF